MSQEGERGHKLLCPGRKRERLGALSGTQQAWVPILVLALTSWETLCSLPTSSELRDSYSVKRIIVTAASQGIVCSQCTGNAHSMHSNASYAGVRVQTLEPSHLGSNLRQDTSGELPNQLGPQFSHP